MKTMCIKLKNFEIFKINDYRKKHKHYEYCIIKSILNFKSMIFNVLIIVQIDSWFWWSARQINEKTSICFRVVTITIHSYWFSVVRVRVGPFRCCLRRFAANPVSRCCRYSTQKRYYGREPPIATASHSRLRLLAMLSARYRWPERGSTVKAMQGLQESNVSLTS